MLSQVYKELDARLPSKRARTEPNHSKWSKGDISTLLYGILRFGEKEFGDLMSTTVFMKPEYEQKIAAKEFDLPKMKETLNSLIPNKNRHSASEIAQKWA